MSSKDLFEKEYSSLRAEIDRNSHIVTTVFLANITVTAALIGYGLGLDKIIGAIFLSPFAIIIPALFFLSSQLESTTRIAAYIKVFFEDNSDELKWETRWLCLREKDLLPAKRKYTFAISHLYGGLSIVCFLLAGFNEDGTSELYSIGVDGAIHHVQDYDANVGSGMPYVLGLLERQYKKELTIKEGIELAKEALKSSTQRDTGSGYGIDIFTISKYGIKKVVSQEILQNYKDEEKY